MRMFTDNVLELPGDPIISTGILFVMQIRVIKIFYLIAVFIAIF